MNEKKPGNVVMDTADVLHAFLIIVILHNWVRKHKR